MKGTHVVGSNITKADHRDTKFEKFLKKIHKNGQSYAEWQNEKYGIKVDRTQHKKKTVVLDYDLGKVIYNEPNIE